MKLSVKHLKSVLFLGLGLGILFFNPVRATDESYTPYIVKKGDTVSSVLYRENLRPLYGKADWVRKVLKLNRLTQDSTRQLNPGDVLILPIPRHFFTAEEIQEDYVLKSDLESDELILAQASLSKIEMRPRKGFFNMPPRHHLEAKAGYFYRETHLKGGGKFSTVQNFKLGAEYVYRDLTPGYWSINPRAEFYGYSQQESSFAEKGHLHATFTPSMMAIGAIEFEHVNSGIKIGPQMEGEYYSRVSNSNQQYQVRKDADLRVGSFIEKTGILSGRNSWARLSYALGVSTSVRKWQSNNIAEKNGRMEARAGSMLWPNFGGEIFADRYQFKAGAQNNINSVGTNLIYKF